MEKINNFFFNGQPSKSDNILFNAVLFGGTAFGIFIWGVNLLVNH